MRLVLLFVCLLFAPPSWAAEIKVDISGGVFCVHDMSKVLTAKVHLYNQGYLGYEQRVGTSNVAEDGFYSVNETINTWHDFKGRLEIDHQCINSPDLKSSNVTLSLDLTSNDTKYVFAPIILDTKEPTKEQFEQFYKDHPGLRNLTDDFVLNYKMPQATWWDLWPHLKDLGIH